MQPLDSIKNYKPLGKRLVVEPIKTSEESIDGIFIPDTVSNKNNSEDGIIGIKCRVISKSDDCDSEAKSLVEGDIIYARPYAFEEIRFNEGLFFSLDERNIRGKFSSEKHVSEL
jgi:co-chaperonin GroES (HSP10)